MDSCVLVICKTLFQRIKGKRPTKAGILKYIIVNVRGLPAGTIAKTRKKKKNSNSAKMVKPILCVTQRMFKLSLL